MIREKIEKCGRFVCIVTPEMLPSQWCLWELSVATRMGKPVVPVLVRAGGQEHSVLRAIQFADFTGGPTEAAMSSLLKGMLVAAPAVPDPGLPMEAPESELLQPYYRRHFSDAIIRQQFDSRKEERFSARVRIWRVEIRLADVQRVETFTGGVLSPGLTGRDRYVELIEQYRP